MADEPIDEAPPPDDVIDPPHVDAPPPPPQNGKETTISDLITKAREGIPVDDRGVVPTDYEHQVVIAKDRSRAHLMLPEHLHNNAAVMTALVAIAMRFNLEPIMLASQTYIQNNRLCFQSQAFGAILYASKMLIGRLRYEFRGEGGDITCTVSGRFKDDPDMVYSATTPPLSQLHPGHTQRDGKSFVKGSPLWDKDNEQQIAYFAQRRWIRRYAPDVCMGMYTREEMAELDEYRAQRDAIPLTSERIGQLDTGEGWGEGAHVEMDLASLEPELPEDPGPDPEEPPARERPRNNLAQKAASQPLRKPAGAKKPIARAKTATPARKPPARPAPPPRAKMPTKAVVRAVANRAERPPAPAQRVRAPTPRWLDYVTKAEAAIAAIATPEEAAKAETIWEFERDVRDQIQVPIGERSRLRAMLDRKMAQHKPKDAT